MGLGGARAEGVKVPGPLGGPGGGHEALGAWGRGCVEVPWGRGFAQVCVHVPIMNRLNNA